jgi:hypothetical protein
LTKIANLDSSEPGDTARNSADLPVTRVAATNGNTTKCARRRERPGWKAVLVRDGTFNKLKLLSKNQDNNKKQLDLAEIADGLIGHMLSNLELAKIGITEGRKRKREEFLAAAEDWAE